MGRPGNEASGICPSEVQLKHPTALFTLQSCLTYFRSVTKILLNYEGKVIEYFVRVCGPGGLIMQFMEIY